MQQYFRLRNSIFCLVVSVLILSSCAQLREMASFAKCEFRLKTIENIRLAGVNVQNVNSINDLSVSDAGRLMTAVALNSFPLQFTLNVDVKNPNSNKASLNRLDWILFIDDIRMVEGTTNNRIEIEPNGGITNYPLLFNMNLREVLSGKAGNSLINFGLNLAGAGNTPTRVTLRAKPYVYVGSVQIPYPGYFDIKNDFVSQ